MVRLGFNPGALHTAAGNSMSELGPIVVGYKLAAPLSWARAMIKPLTHALRRIVPAQAHAQRDVAALDREFNITATTENGWYVGLRFSGPELTLTLYPPEHSRAVDGGFPAALNDDISDIAAGPLERAA